MASEANYTPAIQVPDDYPSIFENSCTTSDWFHNQQFSGGSKVEHYLRPYTQEYINKRKRDTLVYADTPGRWKKLSWETFRDGYAAADKFWQEAVEAYPNEYPEREDRGKPGWGQQWRRNRDTWFLIPTITRKLTPNLLPQGRIKIVYFVFTDSIWEPLKEDAAKEEEFYPMRGFFELRAARYIVDTVLQTVNARDRLKVKFDLDLCRSECDRNEIANAFQDLDQIELNIATNPGLDLFMLKENSLEGWLVVSLRPTGPIRQVIADFDKRLEQSGRGETPNVQAVICPPWYMETPTDPSSTQTRDCFRDKFEETRVLSKSMLESGTFKDGAYGPFSLYRRKGDERHGLVPIYLHAPSALPDAR